MNARALVALALALAVASCTSAGNVTARETPSPSPSQSAQPSATPTPTKPAPTTPLPESALRKYYTQKLEWSTCLQREELQCARLAVPFSYADLDAGADTELGLVRRDARDQQHKVGALVMSWFGVGNDVYFADSFGKRLTDNYDLIGFDRRGFGSSNSLDCLPTYRMDPYLDLDEGPDNAAEWKALLDSAKDFADTCAQAVGVDFLRTMSNEVAARDLDILRTALGEKKLRVWTASSSTTMGVAYAKLFPTKVGRMVLESPELPGGTAMQHAAMRAVSFELGLEGFLLGCVDDGCELGKSRKQARANLVALLDGLEAKPITGTGERWLTRPLAVAAIRYELDLVWWDRLEDELAAARKGKGAELLKRADLLNSRPAERNTFDYRLSAELAVRCLERTGLGDPDPQSFVQTLTKASPIVGSALAREHLPCAFWPVPPAPRVSTVGAPTKTPILIVGAELDTRHPYGMAKLLKRELPAGKLLKSEGFGHLVYRTGDDCADRAIEDYLLEGAVPREGKCL